jgi:hypothetical protein
MNILDTLWRGASYQDHLLQSYRKYHFILQSALLTIATCLTIAILVFGHMEGTRALYLLLLAFTALGLYLLAAMSRLIKARTADVDYYHNQIIEQESTLPKEEQVLTAFKVFQKFGRGKENASEFFRQFQLTDEVRAQLTEKGKGHTRKVLDRNLSFGFLFLWIGLHVSIAMDWLIF